MISRLVRSAFVLFVFATAIASDGPPEYEMGTFQLVFLVEAEPVDTCRLAAVVDAGLVSMRKLRT